MKFNVEYFFEEPTHSQDLTEWIKEQEYARLHKQLRFICYVFQYVVPTLFVTILLLR